MFGSLGPTELIIILVIVLVLFGAGRLAEVQQWGRLLSTRQRSIKLAQRGRLIIPEGFREFLGVEPGSSVMVVGAALCVELWHPENWRTHLAAEIPKFRDLEETLST